MVISPYTSNYSKSPTYELPSCGLSKMPACVLSISGEWHCSLPSVSYCWRFFSSTISHLFYLLQSVNSSCLFTWYQPLEASWCTVLVYFSRSCIIRLKLFSLIFVFFKMYSVQFSHSVVSNSLRSHGLQHARPPCPSPTPGVYSSSCPLSQWCHTTIRVLFVWKAL